ncbi:F-actin capping protein [Hortaea werneckii]|nr:F-actin capping protein [Hortaea werneckii]
MADPFDAALDLLRRLPPSKTASNLNGIISLRPDLEEDLLSSVDVALTVKRCSQTGRDYLCCDYNRDGSSYRSPWSNAFEPPIDPEDAAELVPGGRVRRMEENLNAAVDVYRELYYEGGTSSAYLWALDDGFAGVVLFKKTASAGTNAGKGGWDSIHVLEVNEAATKRSAHYKLTSTVILDLGLSSQSVDSLDLAGNLTRQAQADLSLSGFRDSEVEQQHVVNIGRMVEDMETRMRNLLQEVYFGKAKDVVGDLRSIQPLSEAEKERAAHRDVLEKMHSKMDNSPFTKLSAELRNDIYHLVLYSPEGFNITYIGNILFEDKVLRNENNQVQPLALTATCKALRTETLQLFYAINTFTFKFKHFDSLQDILDAFMDRIGNDCVRALRRVFAECYHPIVAFKPPRGLPEDVAQKDLMFCRKGVKDRYERIWLKDP